MRSNSSNRSGIDQVLSDASEDLVVGALVVPPPAGGRRRRRGAVARETGERLERHRLLLAHSRARLVRLAEECNELVLASAPAVVAVVLEDVLVSLAHERTKRLGELRVVVDDERLRRVGVLVALVVDKIDEPQRLQDRALVARGDAPLP